MPSESWVQGAHHALCPEQVDNEDDNDSGHSEYRSGDGQWDVVRMCYVC